MKTDGNKEGVNQVRLIDAEIEEIDAKYNRLKQLMNMANN